jgi:hypothetical protein
MKAGTKVQSAGEAEAIVVKPPPEGELAFVGDAEVVLGKRYSCGTCGSEVLVTKAGPGSVSCHGAVMVVSQPKTLPSSD